MLDQLEREALVVAMEATQILITKRNSIVVIMPVLVTVLKDTEVQIIIPPELLHKPPEHHKLLQALRLPQVEKVCIIEFVYI